MCANRTNYISNLNKVLFGDTSLDTDKQSAKCIVNNPATLLTIIKEAIRGQTNYKITTFTKPAAFDELPKQDGFVLYIGCNCTIYNSKEAILTAKNEVHSDIPVPGNTMIHAMVYKKVINPETFRDAKVNKLVELLNSSILEEEKKSTETGIKTEYNLPIFWERIGIVPPENAYHRIRFIFPFEGKDDGGLTLKNVYVNLYNESACPIEQELIDAF